METYNKLVRDYIGDKLKANGLNPHLRVLSEDEYLVALLKKLLEESNEAFCAGSISDLKKELCDVQQVIESITEAYKIERNPKAIRVFAFHTSDKRNLLKLLVNSSSFAVSMGNSPAELERQLALIKIIIHKIIDKYDFNRVELQEQKLNLEREYGGFKQRMYLIEIPS